MIVEIPRLKDVDLVLHQTAELAVWGDPAFIAPSRAVPTAAAAGASGLGPSREGAARQWAVGAASAASVAARSAPLRSAWLGSGARARLAAFPFSSAAAPWAASPSKTRVQSSFPAFTDFRERRILPRSLRASLGLSPPASRLPHPVGARAHTHTHICRRACARPRASSRGVSSAPQQIRALPGAATHTGFQPPRGVLCLLLRRRRRRRERRLQPGLISQLRARDRVREKRRRRTPRLGGAAPRPAPHSARRAASAPHTASPGCHPPALHPFFSSRGGLRSAAGWKLSSPPRLRWVLLLLFVTVPSPWELGHLGQVLLGGSAPSQAPREAKEAVGQPDSAAAKVRSSRLGP
nr:uncharacterized protein LOC110567958 [Aotus nancymaae]